MLTQLLLVSSHFTIGVVGALVFFILGVLELASWSLAKELKAQLVRGIGFFILAIVAAIHSTSLDQESIVLGLQIAKVLGLLLVFASMYVEPILHPPPKRKSAVVLPLAIVGAAMVPLSAVMFLLIALIYLRRATEGYDKQLTPAFRGFLLLFIAETLNASFFASGTNVVFWSNLLKEFGIVWIVSHVLEMVAYLQLGIWTWRYLRFRADVQLFITTFTSSLIIFIATTFLFTFHLLNNLQTEALGHLKTDVSVLQYALDSLESEALANAQVVAENSTFKEAFFAGNSEALFDSSLQFMLSQETDFLDVATASGKVVMRAEDRDKIGDSLAGDIAVRNALNGISVATVVSKEGIVAPEIEVRASAPIFTTNAEGEEVIAGAVVTGFSVDSVFVDGVKDVTSLDVTVFGDNIRAATTFVAPDGKSRFLGTKESNDEVLKTVLEDGEVFIGPTNVLNQPYYTAYSPLKSEGDEVIGMLFVGNLQTDLFETAESSIRLTFLGSIVLMGLSIPPNYYLARYIKSNLEV